MPRWIFGAIAILAALSLIPFVLIARARGTKSASPRIHIIQDMDDQPKFRAQQPNSLFADGRATRPPVPGTVAYGKLAEDDHYYRGKVGTDWATTLPVQVTEPMMKRGQERFGIYCAPCHGLAGAGDGVVAMRADRLQEGTWVPPASFHTDVNRARSVGYLFNVITNGVRKMPAYGSQIPEADRWAIVSYVRALQRSQNTPVNEVPPEIQASLR
ncbi:MAG: cytochrome c [Acidobacteria bacterium]|nr:cytochrome c [Acidobacteriota bacterium]